MPRCNLYVDYSGGTYMMGTYENAELAQARIDLLNRMCNTDRRYYYVEVGDESDD